MEIQSKGYTRMSDRGTESGCILEVGLAGLADGGSSCSKIFGVEMNRVYLCLIPSGSVGRGGIPSPKQSFCLHETSDPSFLIVTEGTSDFGIL